MPELAGQLRQMFCSYAWLNPGAGGKIEQAEEVVDRRSVERHVGIPGCSDWVGEVIAAAAGNGGKVPVGFDEFVDRNVIGIVVSDVAVTRVRRHGEEDDAGAVAEEVERLDVAGVVVAAAFVFGDEDRS